MRVYKHPSLTDISLTRTDLFTEPHELIESVKWNKICSELRRLYVIGYPVNKEIVHSLGNY